MTATPGTNTAQDCTRRRLFIQAFFLRSLLYFQSKLGQTELFQENFSHVTSPLESSNKRTSKVHELQRAPTPPHSRAGAVKALSIPGAIQPPLLGLFIMCLDISKGYISACENHQSSSTQ